MKIGFFSKKAFDFASKFPSIFPKAYLYSKPNGSCTIVTTYIEPYQNIKSCYFWDDAVCVGEICEVIKEIK